MGLTRTSSGEISRKIHNGADYAFTVALAGNPNVGKSTVFNALTGMHQHTGNWSGKTVGIAMGTFTHDNRTYCVTDLPGTYSLLTHSPEEEAAREFLTEAEPNLTVVVCAASCLERNLNLVLQILEVTQRVLVCVNLMDEAKKRRIHLRLDVLEERLGVPVIGISARRKADIERLKSAIDIAADSAQDSTHRVRYSKETENAITEIEEQAACSRWYALRLLDGTYPLGEIKLPPAATHALTAFYEAHTPAAISDEIVTAIVVEAENICREAVITHAKSDLYERRIDKILTGRVMAYPVMLLLLLLIFWITIEGANYPSALLSSLLSRLEIPMYRGLAAIGMPTFFTEMLVFGMYRVLSWVVSVMLPPMAIFFPLFTLLEDVGYLPRIAYNLDKCFHKCGTCGKQALTMCMGFGCNAVGVAGCRIIDSPRERLIAMLTNSFVPCNGRFPLLLAMTSLFFLSSDSGNSSLLGAAFLSAIIVFSVLVTLAVSSFLSATLLRGIPSSFTLELPPYRRPAFLSVLVRSVVDRTIYVLGRAAAVAAPAGMLIWLLANVNLGNASLFSHITGTLDPLGRFLGLDGIILTAFILGLPANETVIPIMMMGYMASSSLSEYESLTALRVLLLENGWTPVTALCVVLFSLMHWPCSTTLLTIHKESGSLKWTVAGFFLPTALGAILCAAVNRISQIFVQS